MITLPTGATLSGRLVVYGGIALGDSFESRGHLRKSAESAHQVYSGGLSASPEWIQTFLGNERATGVSSAFSVEFDENNLLWKLAARFSDAPGPVVGVSLEEQQVLLLPSQNADSKTRRKAYVIGSGHAHRRDVYLPKLQKQCVCKVHGRMFIVGGLSRASENQLYTVQVLNATTLVGGSVQISAATHPNPIYQLRVIPPATMQGHSCIAVGHQVIVVGGKSCAFSKEEVLAEKDQRRTKAMQTETWIPMNTVHVLDTQTLVWRAVRAETQMQTDLPPSREMMSSNRIGTGILLYGGRGTDGRASSETLGNPTQATIVENKVRAAHALRILHCAPRKRSDQVIFDDLLYLDTARRPMRWSCLVTAGKSPGRRFGHSAVVSTKQLSTRACLAVSETLGLQGNVLIVYGGWIPMKSHDINQSRHEYYEALAESIFVLDLDHLVWSEVRPQGTGIPRYAHTAIFHAPAELTPSPQSSSARGPGLIETFPGAVSQFQIKICSEHHVVLVHTECSIEVNVQLLANAKAVMYNGAREDILGSYVETYIISHLDGHFSVFYFVPKDTDARAVRIYATLNGSPLQGFPTHVPFADENFAPSCELDPLSQSVADPLRRQLCALAEQRIEGALKESPQRRMKKFNVSSFEVVSEIQKLKPLSHGEGNSVAVGGYNSESKDFPGESEMEQFNLDVSPSGNLLPPSRNKALSKGPSREQRTRSAKQVNRNLETVVGASEETIKQWRNAIKTVDSLLPSILCAPGKEELVLTHRGMPVRFLSWDELRKTLREFRAVMKKKEAHRTHSGARADTLSSIYGGRPPPGPNLEVLEKGDSFLTLRWTDVSIPEIGNMSVHRYILLEMNMGAAVIDKKFCERVSGKTRVNPDSFAKPKQPIPRCLQIKLIGLNPGREYHFRLALVNGVGRGSFSPIVCSVKTRAGRPCPPPCEPVALGTTTSTATLLWISPEQDGGSGILSYEVISTLDDIFLVEELGAAAAGSQLARRASLMNEEAAASNGLSKEALQLICSYPQSRIRVAEIVGLEPNILYNFTVAAVNSVGVGAATSLSPDVQTKSTIPPPLEPPAVLAQTDDSFSIMWQLPLINPSSAKHVKLNIEGSDETLQAQAFLKVLEELVEASAGEFTWYPSEAQRYSVYKVAIAAVNEIGESPPSAPTLLRHSYNSDEIR